MQKIEHFDDIESLAERKLVEKKIDEVLKKIEVFDIQIKKTSLPEINRLIVSLKSWDILFEWEAAISLVQMEIVKEPHAFDDESENADPLENPEKFLWKDVIHYKTPFEDMYSALSAEKNNSILSWFFKKLYGEYLTKESNFEYKIITRDKVVDSFDVVEKFLLNHIKKKPDHTLFLYNKKKVLHIGTAFFFSIDTKLKNLNPSETLDWTINLKKLSKEYMKPLLQKVRDFYHVHCYINNINNEFVERHFVKSQEYNSLTMAVLGIEKIQEEFSDVFSKMRELESIRKQSSILELFFKKMKLK